LGATFRITEDVVEMSNVMAHDKTDARQYVVVFRAPSAAIIERNSFIHIKSPCASGTIDITVRTRFVDKGLDHPLPGDLWIDVRGPALNLESAVSSFGNAASSVTPVIAFATNAAIGILEPELVYDNTPGLEVRDFIQTMLPDERPLIHEGRIVHTDSTKALMRAIEAHSEKERITRAISQYRLALGHWRWGHEILATAHLFIGMETLTKAVARTRQKSKGQSENDFALDLGIDPERLNPCERLSTAIETTVRRDILFGGDEECHRSAKAASDGFEHGFMSFDKIQEHAKQVRDKTALYLRKAVLRLLDIEQIYSETILSFPRDIPLGHWPVVKYIRGQLLGSSDELAVEENEYPILAWRSMIKSVDTNDEGKYSLNFEEKFTPKLGEGIAFKPQTFEVWRP
jgi:hypothetical protein